METQRFRDKLELGRFAAARAAAGLRRAIASRGQAFLLVATGASQFDTLAALVHQPGVDWGRVTAFHLDEYLGLPASHGASFRRYLRERFSSRVGLLAFHEIDGEAPNPEAECARLGRLISAVTVDVALLGIGENGHLAFNDPPADFETREPYLVVELDEACRRQQLGEGWFDTLDAVPRRAISLSVRELLRASELVCSVPDRRKAGAVRDALEGPLTPLCPASILREHPRCLLCLDGPSASLLRA
jgi:glucosamine-6-phosphate deaminase